VSEFPIREIAIMGSAFFGVFFKRIFRICEKPFKFKHKWIYFEIDQNPNRRCLHCNKTQEAWNGGWFPFFFDLKWRDRS
jgi:hypothetical protein